MRSRAEEGEDEVPRVVGLQDLAGSEAPGLDDQAGGRRELGDGPEDGGCSCDHQPQAEGNGLHFFWIGPAVVGPENPMRNFMNRVTLSKLKCWVHEMGPKSHSI